MAKQTFMEATKKAKVRRVDFYIYREDFDAALLGSLGMATAAISARTKLRKGQVSYRLRKAGVRLSDYRSGDSHMAKTVLKNMRPILERELYAHLKDLNHQ
jgi:hypothetical protein